VDLLRSKTSGLLRVVRHTRSVTGRHLDVLFRARFTPLDQREASRAPRPRRTPRAEDQNDVLTLQTGKGHLVAQPRTGQPRVVHESTTTKALSALHLDLDRFYGARS